MRLKKPILCTLLATSIATAGIHQYMEASHKLDEMNKQYKQLKRNHDRLNLKYNELKQDYQLLEEQLDSSKQAIEQLEIDNQQLLKNNQQLRQDLEKQKQENENLKKKLEAMQMTKKPPSMGKKEDGWTYFLATYYDANEQSTGKRPGSPAYGITKSGKPVQEGVTLAVDPRVIPLGTWVLVQYPDGRVEKRQAQDTGSAIKGYKVDIYIPHATLTSGKHYVKIKILD
jgi:3D (Asp-Asp-Asp) domain-containing protein